MKRLSVLLLALAALLGLSGCWDSDSPPVNEEDFWALEQNDAAPEEGAPAETVFTLPYLNSQTLDPISCSDGVQQAVGALLYEGLFSLDETFSPQPMLCEAYTVSPNGLTYTFTLREGVTFSDGSSLSPSDVLTAYRRAQSSERFGARFSNITSMRVNRGVFTVTLRRADSLFPALLDIPIVKAGSEKDTVPLGTGPYLFITDSDGPCLIRNDSWWTGLTPPLDRIPLAPAKNADTAAYLFSAGSAHLLAADLLAETPASGLTDADMTDAPTGTLLFLGFNYASEPLNDVKLRSAMGLAIDRSSLVTTLLAGHAAAAQFPISPASPLYPTELETPYENGAYTAALAAMAPAAPAAEGEDPVPAEKVALTLLVNAENSFKVSLAEHLARQLTEGHIAVAARVLPWAEYMAALESGDFDLWLGEVRLTADWDLTSLVGTRGAMNYGKCGDAAIDTAIRNFLAAGTGAAASALCAQLAEKVPLLPIAFKNSTVLTSTGMLENLSPTAAQPFFRMDGWKIHLTE